MNQISHKQAIQWIDRRLDGLLAEKQISFLDEHLRSCDSCRAYAAEMDVLPAQLQNQFQARWDAKPGPSPKVMQTIAVKARNIPMRNRIFSGAKLFAGAATLILLGVVINFVVSELRVTSTTTGTGTETVSVLPRAEDRLLAFASMQNGNAEIYTMHADGSGLTNLTNDPANDGNPFWSPDGKQIAFLSDRSGSTQLHLMDADGSNVVQLTDIEGGAGFDVNGYSPWSPDGTRLIFVNKLPEEQYWKLYVLNIREKTSLALTPEPGAYLFPSWSPDGEHIIFLSYESESRPLARHLFVIDKSGDNLTELTAPLRIDETGTSLMFQYYWSREGASVFFEASSIISHKSISTVYEASLDGSLTIKTQSEGFVIDWWEGTTLQQEQNARTLTWLRSDGSQSALDVCPDTERLLGTAFKRSQQGNLLFGANCSTAGWKLYWANPDGTSTSRLTEGTIPARDDGLYAVTWSPDDRFIAFLSMDSDSSDFVHTLYVLDVEQARNDPSVQPLKMAESYGPAWQPITKRAEDSSANLQIDPQSCKPFSDLGFETPPPSQLYGYEPIQGMSFVDGDFSYDFWLYCNPAPASGSEQSSNAKVRLGIFSSWDYHGPFMDGPVEYHYEFGPGIVLGGGNWEGPLYSTSITGAKFDVDLMEIQAYIPQGLPIPFRVVIDSPFGKKEATFSFKLEPAENGLRVADLQAKQSETSQAAPRSLLFTSYTQEGLSDIFLALPDGSQPVNLTDHPATDDHPAWSPDGERIAFESDRNGSPQIYLMDADGSNLVQLTAGEAEHKFLDVKNPWSPDGTRLLIGERTQPGSTAETDEWTLFAVSLDGQTKTELARTPAVDLVQASWAPDGKHVAFIVRASQSDRMQIHVVDANGNHPAEVTRLLPSDEELLTWDYSWAADGNSIFFLAGRTAWDSSAGQSGRSVAYEASLDGETLTEKTVSSARMLDWWEGTALVEGMSAGAPFEWLRADGTSQPWKPFEKCEQDGEASYGYMHNRSPNGNSLFAVYCPNNELWLYWANPDGSMIRQLLDAPIQLERFDIHSFAWSPDGKYVAYNLAHPTELIDLYILNVEEALQDPSTQPVKVMEKAVMSSHLSWQPGP